MSLNDHVVVSAGRFREAVHYVERENFRPGDALTALERATIPDEVPGTPGTSENFEAIDTRRLLMDSADYLTFRTWATERGYGDSAYAFRKLLRRAGLLAYDERRGVAP